MDTALDCTLRGTSLFTVVLIATPSTILVSECDFLLCLNRSTLACSLAAALFSSSAVAFSVVDFRDFDFCPSWPIKKRRQDESHLSFVSCTESFQRSNRLALYHVLSLSARDDWNNLEQFQLVMKKGVAISWLWAPFPILLAFAPLVTMISAQHSSNNIKS